MKHTLLLLLTMLLCAPALAQSNNLEVLWQSEPGFRPAGIVLGEGDMRGLDATGDGKPDLVMTRDDDQGNLRDLLVVNSASLDTLWRINDVPTTFGFNLGVVLELWGFADVNGDSQQEALLITETEVRAYDMDSNELAFTLSKGGRGAQFLGAIDLNGDDHEELILFLPDTRQVQVWTWPN